MHILIGNNVYPPIQAGGAELIVANLAEGLVRLGHRVTVVSTCSPSDEPYPNEVRNGVEIIRFFPKNLYWNWERENRNSAEKAIWHLRDAWNLDAGKRFQQIIDEQKPDILHTHLIDGMSAILWQKARAAGIPVIHTAHDYHLLCPRALLLTRSQKICTKPRIPCQIYRKFHLHTTKYIDLFCSPSMFLMEQHLQAGMRAKDFAIVRNGISLPLSCQRRLVSSETKKLLFPARLTTEKGCAVLLDALAILPHDLQFELSVAGKGEYAKNFEELAKRDARIKYLGYITGEEKEAAFQAADWLLIPSLWYENAPVVIVEAAAYGLGVIGSNIGAIPEFVIHEKTGLLFEAGNAESLASAIEKAVYDEQILPNLEENTEQILATASVENMVESYDCAYKTSIICSNSVTT